MSGRRIVTKNYLVRRQGRGNRRLVNRIALPRHFNLNHPRIADGLVRGGRHQFLTGRTVGRQNTETGTIFIYAPRRLMTIGTTSLMHGFTPRNMNNSTHIKIMRPHF